MKREMQIKVIAVGLILIWMWLGRSCAEPQTSRPLQHQQSVILHDDKGHTVVATHIEGDKWELQ